MKKKKYFKCYSIKSLAKRLKVGESFLVRLSKNQETNYKLRKGVRVKNKNRDLYVANYSLEKVLKLIDKEISDSYDFPKTFQGGIKGRSLKANARFHTNKKYILKIDIADFFPSIHPEKVYSCMRGLKIADKPAKTLTSLVTVNYPHPHLPQGFCTSPKIASLILLNFEKRLHSLFKNIDCDYSFWVDDITFSSNLPIGKFKNLIIKILIDEGFDINDKIKLLENNERMIVNGVIVNKFPNITKEKREEISKLLHCLIKFGPVEYLKNTKGSSNAILINTLQKSLLGNINFATSINKKLGLKYKKEFQKINWNIK